MPYKDVTIDPDKPPEEYSYVERRAELLQVIIEAGHPDLVSRTGFAEHYDVVVSTITKDIQALRDEIRKEAGTDAELVTHTVYTKAIREYMKADEYREAVEIVKMWNDWLFDTGKKEKAPEKLEAEVTQREARSESESYAVEEDDASITAEQEQEPEQGTN